MAARSRWAHSAHLLVCRDTERVGQKIAPWSDRHGSSVRDGPSAPKQWKAKEQSSPVCSTRDQRHLAGNQDCRTSGCERGHMPTQVATRPPKAKNRSAANTVRIVPEEPESTSVRVQAARLHSGSSRLLGSQASLNSNCQKTGESTFISNDAARCVQRRCQRFPTVRTVG
jgi:hypothetical protein